MMCDGFEVEDPGAGGVPSPLPATSSSIHPSSPAPLSPLLSPAKRSSRTSSYSHGIRLQGCQDRVLLRACQGDDLGREEQRLLKLLRKRLSMDRDTIQHMSVSLFAAVARPAIAGGASESSLASISGRPPSGGFVGVSLPLPRRQARPARSTPPARTAPAPC